MAKLEDKLFELLQLPDGAKLTDMSRLNEIISLAKDWPGADEGMVDDLRTALEEHTNIRPKAISDLCRNMKMKISLGVVPKTVEEFVEAYTAKNRIAYTLDHRLLVGGKSMDDGDVFNRMFLWTAEYDAFRSRDYLTAAWRNWKNITLEAAQDAFRARIAYDAQAPDPWDVIIDAIVRDDGGIAHYRELCRAILTGAVWRVKNKMNGTHVRQHIMPYLRGKQGCGKTTFLDWFFEPVKEGVANATFEMFDHDEKTQPLRYAPIVFFDEVAKADKADAAKVKNLMTGEATMFRKLYGEATKGAIISTFFGAGNLELEEVFHDATGLRRFFQIEVRPDLYQRLPTLMGTIDPLDLWRSVNENAASPVDEAVVEKLKIAQSHHRNLAPIEAWLAEFVGDCAARDFISVDGLFERYGQWTNSRYPYDKTNINQFSTQLGRILKDQVEGTYPFEKKLHPRTRRSMYQFDRPMGAVIQMNSAVA